MAAAHVHVDPSNKQKVARVARSGHVIVIGNEKGGAGKSTVSFHIAVALMRMGLKTGIIDLDVHQRTLTRYLENRVRWMQATETKLPVPNIATVEASTARHRDHAEREEYARFQAARNDLLADNDIVIIDLPGGRTYLSQLAHTQADTLITPLNDSFVDFDLLGEVDPETLEVTRPGFYAQMVWQCRKDKARTGLAPIDWIVMRNRVSPLAARNKQRVGGALSNLSKRIGFRFAPGFSERVTYRELFPAGLTLLDLTEISTDTLFMTKRNTALTMSHVAARQELRNMITFLKIPVLNGIEMCF